MSHFVPLSIGFSENIILFQQKPESGDPSEGKDVRDNRSEEQNTEEDNG